MVNHSVPHKPLPCRADRSKIIEQAKFVLAEARALAERLDGSLKLLTAEPSAEGTNSPASSFVATGAGGAFPAQS